MKNQDFKISVKTIWGLVIGNFLLTIAGVLAKIQQWDFSHFILTATLVITLTTWVIVLSDMFKNKIYNKTFWIFSMFIIPSIATVFYLFQRNKLMRLGQNGL